MSRIREGMRNLKSNLSFNRKTLTALLILSFVGFIIFSSLGGSVTESFDTTGNSSEELGDPSDTNFPDRNGDLGDLSGFQPPSNFNPPAGSIPDISSGVGSGGIGDFEPPSFNPPDINPPDGGIGGIPRIPGSGGSGPSLPEPQPPGGGGPRLPTFDPNLPSFGDDGDNNISRSPINLPERPNKAANLFNLSELVLFPNTTIEINFDFGFDFGLPDIAIPGFNNFVLLVVLIALLYLPTTIVNNLLATAFSSQKKEGDEDGDEDSLFFKPQKTDAEIRREMQREKRLRSFSDYVKHIIQQIDVKVQEGMKPKNIITWTYLSIDEAFTHFMGLRREKDLTPLEHSRKNFSSHEINNDALQRIVNLFYLTRFGNKELGIDKLEELKSQLGNLIPIDFEETNDEDRGWRIF